MAGLFDEDDPPDPVQDYQQAAFAEDHDDGEIRTCAHCHWTWEVVTTGDQPCQRCLEPCSIQLTSAEITAAKRAGTIIRCGACEIWHTR